MMNKLTNIVTLGAVAGQGEALGRALLEQVAASRAEPGCLGYDLYQGHDGGWIVVETWRDAAALDAHLVAPYTATLVKSFDRLLSGPPKIKTCTPKSLASSD